jgi:hypothetical protein
MKMLVLLDGSTASVEARRDLSGEGVRILQTYGPAVVVVDADPQQKQQLQSKPGVQWVTTEKIGMIPNIDPTGRMGIQVWNANYDVRPKERKWEGYSWGYAEAEKEG